jgi:tetratricopeptide (TPR) repeat protein
LFCFEAGINPDHLISAFEKLQALTNEDSKKKNWHHYNISQRIETLKLAKEDTGFVKKHDKMLLRHIIAFLAGVVLLFSFSINFESRKTDMLIHLSYLLQKAEENPQNKELKGQIGMYYHEIKNWEKAVKFYTQSLKLDYNQAEILNNLSWLLLKCPNQDLQHPDLALQYAKDALLLKRESFILDTLAEAYLQNNRAEEAMNASKEAYIRAPLSEKSDYLKKYKQIKNKIKWKQLQ